MKRSWPALLLVPTAAAIAWFALSASFEAEREYADFVHEIGGGADTRVLDSHFQRGWLSSDAETSIEVSGATGLVFRSAMESLGAHEVRDRFGVRMRHHIEHGWLPLFTWVHGGFAGRPLLAYVRSTIEIDQESQQALAEVIGALPLIAAHTELRSGGAAHCTFSMAPIALRAKGPGYERGGRWLGFEADLTLSDGFKHASGTLRSPGFSNGGLDRTLDVHDIGVVFDWPGDELPVGRMTVEIGQIAIGAAMVGVPTLSFGDVGLQVDTSLRGAHFEGTLALGAQSVGLGADHFGPGTIHFALGDVDAQAFRQARNTGLRVPAHERTDEPAPFALVAVDLLEALPQLVARGPRISIQQLQLTTPQGPLQARGEAVLAPPGAAADARTFSAYLRGEAEASLPRALLDKLLDARARSEVAVQASEVTDDAVRVRAAADLDALRAQGLVFDGDRARWGLIVGGGLPPRATPAEAHASPTSPAESVPALAPSAPPSEAAQPAGAREKRVQPGAGTRRARAPMPPPGAAEPVPVPAAPAPAPASSAAAAPAPSDAAPASDAAAPDGSDSAPAAPAADAAPVRVPDASSASAAMPDPAGETEAAAKPPHAGPHRKPPPGWTGRPDAPAAAPSAQPEAPAAPAAAGAAPGAP